MSLTPMLALVAVIQAFAIVVLVLLVRVRLMPSCSDSQVTVLPRCAKATFTERPMFMFYSPFVV